MITKNDKYLLTGATGFLGSHIMAGLLLHGKEVVIAGRSSGGITLKERIIKLLKWFGIEHLAGQLDFYETDFLKEKLGLSDSEYQSLCNRRLSIIHCASDTSFAEKNRANVMKSNVESLTEILTFSIVSKSPFFHFISSAYTSNTEKIECSESLDNSIHFTNVYEESKAFAEGIVSSRCSESNIPYTIIRPSIVYGDSVSGKSLKFNALYYPVRSLQQIKDIYLHDIKINSGKKSLQYGIYLNDNGLLNLPLRIFIPHEGKINLIPVNYFTDTILTILEKPLDKTFYHITSNNPLSMATLANYTERFLNITGIEVVIGTPSPDEMKNPAEELFDHFIKAYKPYISDKRVFLRENTDKITGNAFPPDLSYEIFHKCMKFAVSVDWGKKLFIS